jgi:hypothetical protein
MGIIEEKRLESDGHSTPPDASRCSAGARANAAGARLISSPAIMPNPRALGDLGVSEGELTRRRDIGIAGVAEQLCIIWAHLVAQRIRGS